MLRHLLPLIALATFASSLTQDLNENLQPHGVKPFAYQVGVYASDKNICGGAIIAPSHILTAAECCFDEEGEAVTEDKLMQVIAGTLELNSALAEVRKVKKCIVHPEYRQIGNDKLNNIAIIQVKSSFKWTNDLEPIGIETANHDSVTCRVSHWPIIEGVRNKSLQYADVPLLSREICLRRTELPDVDNTVFAGITHILKRRVKRVDCEDGYGQPLVCNGKLVGLSSMGTGCPITKAVVAYTDVGKYLPWIEKVVRDNDEELVEEPGQSGSTTLSLPATTVKTPLPTTGETPLPTTVETPLPTTAETPTTTPSSAISAYQSCTVLLLAATYCIFQLAP